MRPNTSGVSLSIILFPQANWNATLGQAPISVPPNGHPGVFRLASDVALSRDAFFRTRKQGRGMSRPLARTIVKSHNGCIWEENKNDGGGEFLLPLALP